MKKHVSKIIKIQSLIRGKIVRNYFGYKIKEAWLKALRGTKKWICITRIQAYFRGWSLRNRKKKGLLNVKFIEREEDDLDDHLGFFENEELLKANDFEIDIPEDNPEMMRMFAMIAGKKAALPPLNSKTPAAPNTSSSRT